jgi:hypothetical protein
MKGQAPDCGEPEYRDQSKRVRPYSGQPPVIPPCGGSAFVHGAVAFGHLVERQGQVRMQGGNDR